jgi:hypothetical protein
VAKLNNNDGATLQTTLRIRERYLHLSTFTYDGDEERNHNKLGWVYELAERYK